MTPAERSRERRALNALLRDEKLRGISTAIMLPRDLEPSPKPKRTKKTRKPKPPTDQ
jgi:hypothetical protein